METSKHMATHLCLLRGFGKPKEIPCIHHFNSKHRNAGCSPQRKPLPTFCPYLFEEGGCQNTNKSHHKGKWKSTKVVQKVTTKREKPTASLLKSKWPRRQHGSRQCGLNPTPPLDPVLCLSTWISLALRRAEPCPGWTQMFVFQLQRFTDLWASRGEHLERSFGRIVADVTVAVVFNEASTHKHTNTHTHTNKDMFFPWGNNEHLVKII